MHVSYQKLPGCCWAQWKQALLVIISREARQPWWLQHLAVTSSWSLNLSPCSSIFQNCIFFSHWCWLFSETAENEVRLLFKYCCCCSVSPGNISAFSSAGELLSVSVVGPRHIGLQMETLPQSFGLFLDLVIKRNKLCWVAPCLLAACAPEPTVRVIVHLEISINIADYLRDYRPGKNSRCRRMALEP